MSTAEQLIEIICPAINGKAEIRIIYDVDLGRMCPIYFKANYCECNLSHSCPAYQSKDRRCYLFREADVITETGGE